jgi:hypothetical protein
MSDNTIADSPKAIAALKEPWPEARLQVAKHRLDKALCPDGGSRGFASLEEAVGAVEVELDARRLVGARRLPDGWEPASFDILANELAAARCVHNGARSTIDGSYAIGTTHEDGTPFPRTDGAVAVWLFGAALRGNN